MLLNDYTSPLLGKDVLIFKFENSVLNMDRNILTLDTAFGLQQQPITLNY